MNHLQTYESFHLTNGEESFLIKLRSNYEKEFVKYITYSDNIDKYNILDKSKIWELAEEYWPKFLKLVYKHINSTKFGYEDLIATAVGSETKLKNKLVRDEILKEPK